MLDALDVSPVYLADTLRRIEARQAKPVMPAKEKKQPRRLVVVGYYGTIDSVLGVDRRPRGVDPLAVETAITGIVHDYLEPDENEFEDATIGNEHLIRGIPAVGRVSGAIAGTDPVRVLFPHQRKR